MSDSRTTQVCSFGTIVRCTIHNTRFFEDGDCIECMSEKIDQLREALLKVKENVENEGWCPICDEHTCREGNCILAGLEP